jgi:hypothetical protein
MGTTPSPVFTQAATTSALPACTLSGNTLTANSNGAFTAVDGYSIALNDLVLIKNQSDQTQNMIYQLTTVGDASHPWVLTYLPMLTSGDELDASPVFVPHGNTYAGTVWAISTESVILGTDNVNFQSYSGGGTAMTVQYPGLFSSQCKWRISRIRLISRAARQRALRMLEPPSARIRL